jgi:hypothetical protein
MKQAAKPLIIMALWFSLLQGPPAWPGEAAPSPTAPPAGQPQLPVYQPPLRGAPGGRIGGGTRGLQGPLPVLIALAPTHAAMTADEQPALFWFVSAPTTHPLELTLVDDRVVPPLVSIRLSPPVPAGIHRLDLKEQGVRLQTGVHYQWFVALVVDSDRRSRDVLTGATLERMELPAALRDRLTGASDAAAVRAYAEAGIWYDAVARAGECLQQNPDDRVCREQRAVLLEQIDLPGPAAFDRTFLK